MMLKENLKIVKEKIAESAKKSGRNPDEIKLIAVSKTNPISKILEAFEAGATDFGENKALEFRDKTELIAKKVTWHFIGHLQRNKVKYVIKSADYIHSVENYKLALEINKRAAQQNKMQKILFEINTSGEEAKFGLKNFEELLQLAQQCDELPNITPVGLMTMAAFTNNEVSLRKSFVMLREMRDKISIKYPYIKELSMGMTNDYTIAIEEGATMVRIGTAIFGKRDLSLSWNEK
jgi:pyridoxal phosphate enzyme (YggS family)